MGWLYMHRAGMGGFDTPKAYLDNQLTWERENEETGSFEGCRVIRSVSTTGAYYAAVQRFGPNNQTHAISAVICLVRWNPKAADGLLFGYKDMDETPGRWRPDVPEISSRSWGQPITLMPSTGATAATGSCG